MTMLLETPAGIVLAVALCLAVYFALPRFFKRMFPPDPRPKLPRWFTYVSYNFDDLRFTVAYGWTKDPDSPSGYSPKGYFWSPELETFVHGNCRVHYSSEEGRYVIRYDSYGDV